MRVQSGLRMRVCTRNVSRLTQAEIVPCTIMHAAMAICCRKASSVQDAQIMSRHAWSVKHTCHRLGVWHCLPRAVAAAVDACVCDRDLLTRWS